MLSVYVYRILKIASKAVAARSAEPALTVYENEANDYTIQLPSSITENAGIKIQQDDYEIELIPAGGDYSHSAVT